MAVWGLGVEEFKKFWSFVAICYEILNKKYIKKQYFLNKKLYISTREKTKTKKTRLREKKHHIKREKKREEHHKQNHILLFTTTWGYLQNLDLEPFLALFYYV